MAAGLRAVIEAANLIDAVLEVRDARLPQATAVADLHHALKRKPTIILLNRIDLANPELTQSWLRAFAQNDRPAYGVIGTKAGSLRPLRKALSGMTHRRARLRVAVVGAPNTGKSSVINALLRRKSNLTQNRPGVTRQVKWTPLDGNAELLDTPGVLLPRISDGEAVWRLALCGILPDSAFDAEDVATQFLAWLGKEDARRAVIDLDSVARQRGMLRLGGEPDRLTAAHSLIDGFRKGKFGRITFEEPTPEDKT